MWPAGAGGGRRTAGERMGAAAPLGSDEWVRCSAALRESPARAKPLGEDSPLVLESLSYV